MTEENDHSTQRGRWAESVALRGHQNRVHRNRGVKNSEKYVLELLWLLLCFDPRKLQVGFNE